MNGMAEDTAGLDAEFKLKVLTWRLGSYAKIVAVAFRFLVKNTTAGVTK